MEVEIKLGGRFIERIANRVKARITDDMEISKVEEIITEEFMNSNALGNKPTKKEIHTILKAIIFNEA